MMRSQVCKNRYDLIFQLEIVVKDSPLLDCCHENVTCFTLDEGFGFRKRYVCETRSDEKKQFLANCNSSYSQKERKNE